MSIIPTMIPRFSRILAISSVHPRSAILNMILRYSSIHNANNINFMKHLKYFSHIPLLNIWMEILNHLFITIVVRIMIFHAEIIFAPQPLISKNTDTITDSQHPLEGFSKLLFFLAHSCPYETSIFSSLSYQKMVVWVVFRLG